MLLLQYICITPIRNMTTVKLSLLNNDRIKEYQEPRLSSTSMSNWCSSSCAEFSFSRKSFVLRQTNNYVLFEHTEHYT